MKESSNLKQHPYLLYPKLEVKSSLVTRVRWEVQTETKVDILSGRPAKRGRVKLNISSYWNVRFHYA